MKKSKVLFPVCLILFLTGCASKPQSAKDEQKWSDDWTVIGTSVGVEASTKLTLLDIKEGLAADGLYYATWISGNSVSYENSEGDTIDLYDAQLYFLTNEAVSEKKAKASCAAWLAAAKENYEILAEDTVSLGGQNYTLITYNCINEDNPYARGVSAFGVCETTAVCAELVCVEDYTEDLKPLLSEFLNHCHFKED